MMIGRLNGLSRLVGLAGIDYYRLDRQYRHMILALTALAILAAYLAATAHHFGLPDMVSDTYYQLGQKGWMFTLVMVTVAVMMMIAILDMGKGIQCMAFLGCSGLAFVGCAPNYCDKDAYPIHKGGAMVAALGCVGWCMSVCVWPTIAIIMAYALYIIRYEIYKIYDGVWHTSRGKLRWLYWGEVACFTDVFVTYAVAQI